MLTSLHWLNRCLAPAGLTADDAEAALLRQGFPTESREPLPGGDVRMDVELTSNRGDCLCHLALAREIAAATGRRLALPAIPPGAPAGAKVETITSVENTTPDECPLFTARVVKGVKVGPSPKWLVDALESVGQRSINNVVDASNYILFEVGQPTHAFDLNTLAGKRLVVRWAKRDEPLVTLDGARQRLRTDELVVADADRAVSLAGVIGGLETGVTEGATDVLLEAATWSPTTVRRAARRLGIRTDASHRFERVVDPRQIAFAAERLGALVVQLTGGKLAPGLIEVGPARGLKPSAVIMRAERCRAIMGVDVATAEMVRLLGALEIRAVPGPGQGTLSCLIPAHRPDLTREIDLIEEVARSHGLDKIPVRERIEVDIRPPPPEHGALRELAAALTGAGFIESVTSSFVSQADAEQFLPAGMRALHVDESRRAGENFLRPAVAPSLLRCRKINHDRTAGAAAGAERPFVALFEVGPAFAEPAAKPGATVEARSLAMLIDAPDRQEGVRRLRGALEAVARALGGPTVDLAFAPAPPSSGALLDGACATVSLGGKTIGWLALASDEAVQRFDLPGPVALAEVRVEPLLSLYPPTSRAPALPEFPCIERDLSVVVPETTPWGAIEEQVRRAAPAKMERLDFVGAYRGKQLGAGKKSVTLRLRFRDAQRTLRHDEVDPQVNTVVEALRAALGAELRA